MPNHETEIAKMRTLINAQTTDAAWQAAVSEATGIDTERLTIDMWNEVFDTRETGIVEEALSFNGLAWLRPDGALPMLVTDQVPQHVTLSRFLMFAKIIKLLREGGQLSFVKAGVPTEWKRAKVYCNGAACEGVVSADALLGTIEYLTRDKKSKLIPNKEDGFETTTVSGIVQIVVNQDVQTFF